MTKVRSRPGLKPVKGQGTDEENEPTIGDEDADGMDRLEMRKRAAAEQPPKEQPLKDKPRHLPT